MLSETIDKGRFDSWLRGRQPTSDSRWHTPTQDEHTGPDGITGWGDFRIADESGVSRTPKIAVFVRTIPRQTRRWKNLQYVSPAIW